MKRVLKIVGFALLGIIALIALSAAYVGMSDVPSYDVEEVTFEANVTPESVERGKKLASMLCASCHINRETGVLSGTKMPDAPAEFGVIYSANITHDKDYGIGDWTDGEIVRLLRTGVKKNRQYAPPYMAKLPHMADDDINAIISFLRSDDPMVAAVNKPDPPCEPSFLTKFLCRVAFKPFPMPDHSIDMPDTNNMVELGKYLAYNLDCFSCHSADFKTNDFLEPENSVGYFAGGNKPLDLKGRVKVTANLTPHKESGIGDWTEEQFVKALKYGLKDDEPALEYPMLPYSQLTDMEASAIFAYLKTIPAIDNKVERSLYDD